MKQLQNIIPDENIHVRFIPMINIELVNNYTKFTIKYKIILLN